MSGLWLTFGANCEKAPAIKWPDISIHSAFDTQAGAGAVQFQNETFDVMLSFFF